MAYNNLTKLFEDAASSKTFNYYIAVLDQYVIKKTLANFVDIRRVSATSLGQVFLDRTSEGIPFPYVKPTFSSRFGNLFKATTPRTAELCLAVEYDKLYDFFKSYSDTSTPKCKIKLFVVTDKTGLELNAAGLDDLDIEIVNPQVFEEYGTFEHINGRNSLPGLKSLIGHIKTIRINCQFNEYFIKILKKTLGSSYDVNSVEFIFNYFDINTLRNCIKNNIKFESIFYHIVLHSWKIYTQELDYIAKNIKPELITKKIYLSHFYPGRTGRGIDIDVYDPIKSLDDYLDDFVGEIEWVIKLLPTGVFEINGKYYENPFAQKITRSPSINNFIHKFNLNNVDLLQNKITYQEYVKRYKILKLALVQEF